MLKALSYRKKVAKMLFVIVAVFAACGLPLHVTRLLSEFSQIPPSAYHFKVRRQTLFINNFLRPRKSTSDNGCIHVA